MIAREHLEILMAAEAEPAVSIFLPTHVTGRELRQDPIRLKNLIGEAEDVLTAGGMRPADAAALMEPVRDLLGQEEFWRYSAQGLAVFVNRDGFHVFRVPIDLAERVTVGRHFQIKPLLPALAGDGRFYVLALNAKQARVYQGSRFSMTMREDAELPESVEVVQAETDYQNMQHASPVARPRSGAPGGIPKTHTFGDDPEALRRAQLIEWLRRVGARLESWLGSSQSPVVLAGDPDIQGHFRNLSHIRALLPEGILADPDGIGESEVHRRAYELVRPHLEVARREALEQFLALYGDGGERASILPGEIVKASRYSRVDKLLLVEDQPFWGHFDEAADRVEALGSAGDGGEDLFDYAAAQTLRHGGEVYLVRKEELPEGALAGAVLRF